MGKMSFPRKSSLCHSIVSKIRPSPSSFLSTYETKWCSGKVHGLCEWIEVLPVGDDSLVLELSVVFISIGVTLTLNLSQDYDLLLVLR